MATVKKLDKDNYEVRWDEYDAQGKRHQRRKHFDRLNKANDFAKELDADQPYEASTSKFDEWIQRWFDAYKSRIEVTTAVGYKKIVERCKLHFGNKALKKVSPSDIEAFYAVLTDPEHPLTRKPLASSSVQRHHALLHRAFEMALRDKLVRQNPCDLIDRPKSSRQEPVIPAQREVQARFDVLVGRAVYLPCAIALVTGMRQSEVLGLKWDAVNMSANRITVRRVRQYIGEKRIKDIPLNAYTRRIEGMPGYLERDCTKSKKNRIIAIAPELTKLLRSAQKQQMKNRLKFGDKYVETEYVCTYEDGQPMGAPALSKAMKGVCRYHDLRHINGLQLLKAGHSVATVADRLGHTTPQTTLNFYAHSLEDQDREAAKTMTDIFRLKTRCGSNVADGQKAAKSAQPKKATNP